MATEFTLIRLTHEGRAVDLDLGQQPSGAAYEGLAALANYFDALNAGIRNGKAEIAGGAARAAGTWTTSAGTGALTCTINGVTINRTWATSDTATAAALANDINTHANALINSHVSATSVGGVVTITSKTPGNPGNAITLAGTGTGVTVSGARLTGGTESLKTYARGM